MNLGITQSPEQQLRAELIEMLSKYERMDGGEKSAKIIREMIKKLL